MTEKSVHSFQHFKNSKDSKRPHYLVVGQPIGHSLSPLMHNVALRYYGIPAEYFAVEIGQSHLNDFISWINRDEFLGCNITIPYKQQLLPAVDQLSNEAETLGAINTVSKNSSGSSVKGHNTDIFGFQVPLMKYEESIDYGRAIIFGTGGASLAVQYSLSQLGFEEIILVSRNPATAQPLSTDSFTRMADYSQWQDYAEDASLLVNTTPLGMGKLKNESVLSSSDSVDLEGKICYDLIYNPRETLFLKQSGALGASVIDGLDMLIHQGSKSFEIWTGKPFPIDLVKSEVQKILGDV